MSDTIMELHFRQPNDTPLHIVARDIEIVPTISEDNLMYFGIGSTFRYRDKEYKIIDIETKYLNFGYEKVAKTDITASDDLDYIRICYKVELLH